MRRSELLATVTLATVLLARPAMAAYETGCCACLPNPVAMLAAPPPPEPVRAIACALVEGTGYPDFVQQCQTAGGTATSSCPEPTPGQSCTAALGAEGILCPGSPGAPAAGSWGLAALAGVLAIAGALAARRTRRA